MKNDYVQSEQEAVRELLPIARSLVKGPRIRRSIPGGYDVKPGEKVLIAVHSYYDEAVVKAITQAIKEAGATVDIISYDMGPDRELDFIDEMNGFIHNWKSIQKENPVRRWIERERWVEKIAEEQRYDFLVHTSGGPIPATNYAYEGIPWIGRENFPAANFPYPVWERVDRKAWEKIWRNAPGGRGKLTDPEGTNISWTFWEEYFDPDRYKKTGSRSMFAEKPHFGHLFGRPTPPFIPKDDAEGVVAGTINHIGRPFPNIKVCVSKNQVVRVEGGGGYGDLVRELLDDSKQIKYPEHPGKGFLYWWELAIGTNPKIVRPLNNFMLSRAGAIIERHRAGMIHMGFGTAIYSPSEVYAEEERLIYGHVHVHLLFANFEIETKDGRTVKIIENGHLTALDDPEVIEVASRFGDPKEVLKETWIPPIPGISVPGDYNKDYARDPVVYMKKYQAFAGKTSA